MQNEILIIRNKKEERFLRKPTKDVDLEKLSKEEIHALIEHMKRVMRLANGIGLSANQIGLTARVFVAEVPAKDGEQKFYAVFNPRIEKLGEEKTTMEEGCLSVPGVYGPVNRSSQITISGFDKKGKKIRIKAWGLLAKVFQHEIDHLDGKLFIDKAEELHEIQESDRLRAKEDKG